MTTDIPREALQLQSLVKPEGELEVWLVRQPVPEPAEHEVLVRLQAAPLNPSDLGLLFGAADLDSVRYAGTDDAPVLAARVPDSAMPAMRARLGQSLPVGNEGAGLVVAAGASPAAQALLGKTVAVLGGAMYAQYRAVPAEACLVLPEGATAADGASSFVNPLTALSMVENMRRDGHKALVHTAAASNLGQMLVRICRKDGIGLVNIVRRQEQAELLRGLGAEHVCDMSAPDFTERLTEALAATGATIAFDATGGGRLAGQILGCMEAALARTASEYSRYGSTTHKQVFLYGRLDPSPVVLGSSVGMAWGIGGWLMFPYLQKIGAEATAALKQRVMAELKTTFASRYAGEISLAGMLRQEAVEAYAGRSTGKKYLVNPSLDSRA